MEQAMHDSKYVLVERERLERLELVAECARDVAYTTPDFFDPRYYQYSVGNHDMEELLIALVSLQGEDFEFTVRRTPWRDEFCKIRYYAKPIRGVIRARAQVLYEDGTSTTWNKLSDHYGWEQETSPNEGGCWICHRATGDDWLFSMEYDCHVHKSCLERAEPDEEVEIMRREFGIDPQTKIPNS